MITSQALCLFCPVHVELVSFIDLHLRIGFLSRASANLFQISIFVLSVFLKKITLFPNF